MIWLLILRNLAVCVLDRETTFAVSPVSISCASSISLHWVGEIDTWGFLLSDLKFLDRITPKKASIVQLMPYSGKLDELHRKKLYYNFKQ